jgi:hypothetical protein
MDYHTDDIDIPLQEACLVLRRDFVDKRQTEAETFNCLLCRHLPSSVESWTCDEDGWKFRFQEVTIAVYNEEFGTLSVVANSETMHRRFLDEMRWRLREFMRNTVEIDLTPTGFAIKLLGLCEETDAWQRAWYEELRKRAAKHGASFLGDTSISKQGYGWDARQVQSWESILDNPFGVNLSSIEDTAQHLLGKHIAEICSKISEDLRILHVEPVFRNDLVAKFLKRQASMHRHLLNMPYGALRQSVSPTAVPRGSREDCVEGLADELCRQRVTFHGAPHRVIQSIVRYGFILPGEQIGDTGKALAIRCGSTFGQGIYSSPDPMYASMYLEYDSIEHGAVRQPADVPGMRLLVCAVLMGRPMERFSTQRHLGGLFSDHAHSHVSPNQMQYVVFDSAQIIPVYVLHLDYGAEYAREEFDRLAQNPEQYFWRRRQVTKVDKVEREPPTCPGDVQRKKQALKAAAAKWFPYGYGPAQGTSFVIEDIADVSDDEEAYGDLQEARMEQDNEIREHFVDKGLSWFDEFQTVRKTNHGVNVKDNR